VSGLITQDLHQQSNESDFLNASADFGCRSYFSELITTFNLNHIMVLFGMVSL